MYEIVLTMKHGTIFVAHNVAPPGEEAKKLQDLMIKSQKPLLRISTVFPFDLFPDTLIVDVTKVHIISRQFFASEEIHSIPIKSIVDVYVETGPIFATLRVLPQMVFQHQVTQISQLWKSDAIKARDIIQGLIVATKEDVNIAKLPEEEDNKSLRKDLEKLGKTQLSY